MFDISRDARPEVVDFLRELARDPDPLALIVVGLDRGLVPLEVLPRTLFETLGDLTKEEVDDGVRQIARDLELPIDPTAEMAGIIFDGVARGPDFNYRLSNAMRQYLALVLERNSIAEPSGGAAL